MDLNELLIFCSKKGVSDLHLSAGLPPIMRIDGELQRIEAPILNKEMLLMSMQALMNEQQRLEYDTFHETDFSYEIADVARFRVNVSKHQQGVASVFRIIPPRILTAEELGLPEIFYNIIQRHQGLILITGPTGSGKSTTLSVLIDYLNKTQCRHILTIEDPIEFVYQSQRCLITQREVHRDSKSFTHALRAALRADPDIILLGEMRDLETIRLALTAAETGHLVLATLHTASAAKAIDRVIDVFPAEEKNIVRMQLAESLQAIISQHLVKRQGGGRVAIQEILIANSAVRNLIRENKIAQIYSVMQSGSQHGMRTLDQHLKQLTMQKIISAEVAATHAVQQTKVMA